MSVINLSSCLSWLRATVADDPERSFAIGLIAMYTTGMLWLATQDSPTMLEPAFLASGVYTWDFGRFDVFRVNPPLVRIIASIPAVTLGCQRDWDAYDDRPGGRSEFGLGRAFVRSNGEWAQSLVVYGRWCVIPFGVLGLFACFYLGRMLGGNGAGLISVAFWCLDPTIAGHGHLMTTDVPAAALSVAFVATWLSFMRQREGEYSWIVGLAIGIGLLVKYTLILVGITCLILTLARATYWLLKQDYVRVRNDLRGTAIAVAVALVVVNFGYLLRDIGRPLGSFQFVSAALNGRSPGAMGNRFRGSFVESVPILLPADFILGIDQQKLDHEQYPSPSYLRGTWRRPGWWYYYIFAFVVKSTLGWLLLLTLSSVAACVHRIRSRPCFDWGMLACLVPAAVIVVVASSQTAFTNHYRYMLPALALLFPIVASQVVALGRAYRPFCWLFAICVSLSGIEAACAFPQGLSYFNTAAGGPANGPKLLLHSNSDWGQDLVRLKKWLQQEGVGEENYLAYWGPCSPAALGVTARLRPPDFNNPGGWWFVSQNLLNGDITNLTCEPGVDERLVLAGVRQLAQRKVDVYVGDSIVGFRISSSMAEGVFYLERKDNEKFSQ